MTDNLIEFKNEIHIISTESGWRKIKRSYEHYALLVISEICEAVNADRKNKHANIKLFEDSIIYNMNELHLNSNEYIEEYKKLFNTYMKDTYEDEFADICIRILDMCDIFSFDLNFIENIKVDGNSLTEKMFNIVKEFSSDKSEKSLNKCFNQIVYIFNDLPNLMYHIKYKIEYNKYNAKTHNKKY